MNQSERPIVYTRREGAKIAKMSLRSFDEALRRHDFVSVKVGRRVLVPAQALEQVLSGATSTVQ